MYVAPKAELVELLDVITTSAAGGTNENNLEEFPIEE